jgi:hypothetical protein
MLALALRRARVARGALARATRPPPPPPRFAHAAPSPSILARALSSSSPPSSFAAAPSPSPSPAPSPSPSRANAAAAAAALKPAILVCTSKVVDASQRDDYERWLNDGKSLIDAVLRDKDEREGVASPNRASASLGPGRFSWVHFPAHASDEMAEGEEGLEHVRHSGAPRCEVRSVR